MHGNGTLFLDAQTMLTQPGDSLQRSWHALQITLKAANAFTSQWTVERQLIHEANQFSWVELPSSPWFLTSIVLFALSVYCSSEFLGDAWLRYLYQAIPAEMRPCILLDLPRHISEVVSAAHPEIYIVIAPPHPGYQPNFNGTFGCAVSAVFFG